MKVKGQIHTHKSIDEVIKRLDRLVSVLEKKENRSILRMFLDKPLIGKPRKIRRLIAWFREPIQWRFYE
jgi:hypothetical protein